MISDQNLIINIREGDEVSLLKFLERYKSVFKICSKKYHINLDDIQQMAFLIILNPNLNIKDYEKYFYRVFKNEGIRENLYKFRNELCFEIYDYMLVDKKDDDEINFEGYISEFDFKTKEVFRMRFKYDYTYKKIAEVLDMNISEVYRVIKHNCNILKSFIQNEKC